jgi:hypothetical protein
VDRESVVVFNEQSPGQRLWRSSLKEARTEDEMCAPWQAIKEHGDLPRTRSRGYCLAPLNTFHLLEARLCSCSCSCFTIFSTASETESASTG